MCIKKISFNASSRHFPPPRHSHYFLHPPTTLSVIYSYQKRLQEESGWRGGGGLKGPRGREPSKTALNFGKEKIMTKFNSKSVTLWEFQWHISKRFFSEKRVVFLSLFPFKSTFQHQKSFYFMCHEDPRHSRGPFIAAVRIQPPLTPWDSQSFIPPHWQRRKLNYIFMYEEASGWCAFST